VEHHCKRTRLTRGISKRKTKIRAILTLQIDFLRPKLQHALRYVQTDMCARLDDPAYRNE